ncbi:MAG: phosphoserine phosphatase [Alphaproteobacteria bacterium]|jgi:phosphoserine phosphatase
MEAIIIIMSPDDVTLSPDIMQTINRFLEQKQIIAEKVTQIIPNHCTHLYCHIPQDLKALQNELSIACADYKIDIAVLPAQNRLKKLFISDMDSTIINQECIDELADFIGKKSQISAITQSAMQGALNFEESLINRVALLKGIEKSQLNICFDTKITLMSGAKALLDFMKKNQSHTILVSGGFTFFAEKIANILGFDHYHANILNFNAHNMLDGTVAMPILGRESKADILNDYVAKHDLTLSECLAVGDGANDLAMLKAAGLGVAYHAKPAVAEAARIAINFCDLKALIYLQMP